MILQADSHVKCFLVSEDGLSFSTWLFYVDFEGIFKRDGDGTHSLHDLLPYKNYWITFLSYNWILTCSKNKIGPVHLTCHLQGLDRTVQLKKYILDLSTTCQKDIFSTDDMVRWPFLGKYVVHV